MNLPNDHFDRWLVLACDATTGDLALQERDECQDAREEHRSEFAEFEQIAAALAVGLTPAEEMPEDCRDRILGEIEATRSPTPMLRMTDSPTPVVRSRKSSWKFVAISGWAMAAVLGIVVGTTLLVQSQGQPDPSQRRQVLIAGGAQPLAWGEWDDGIVAPAHRGVTGDVVWDDDRQEGYMRFVGLAANNASESQYQLWILDGRYENPLAQRVSGGVFNVSDTGEVIVPIQEGMSIDDAVGFAITIERPGGVWVSDMSERVVIALKG